PWTDRPWESWKLAPPRKCKVCSGAREGAGPTTQEQQLLLLQLLLLRVLLLLLTTTASAAAAATTTAAGSLPRATPRKKDIQEKKSLGGGWLGVTLGGAFSLWGQRLKATPLELATFPPILGVPLLGRPKRYSFLPLEPKQPKHSSTGRRTVAKKTGELEPVTSENKDPNRNAVPQAQ
ncbi:Hypothetical predicted protein, partial [Marmota monax]